MTDLLKYIYDCSDSSWVMKHTKELYELEFPQTFESYAKSANYVYNLLKSEGFDTQMLTFPADGKTVYQDKRTPLAWKATKGRLTVISEVKELKDPVIADYEKMPFSLVKHSVSTPEGGIRTRVITQAQAFSGVDCKGTLVLLESEKKPSSSTISAILDLGALGFITDYLSPAEYEQHAVHWSSAATDDGYHWHVQCEDRDFIAFAITPANGRILRYAVNVGAVEVLVESDGVRYEGEINAVTALIPGKSKKEVWAFAHLYEPLASDNSVGVMTLINALRDVRRLSESNQLEYSVRAVFAMELYGFAAVADYFGGALHNKVLGAINVDAMPVMKHEDKIALQLTPAASPFYGNYILQLICRSFGELFGKELITETHYDYMDDMSLGDSTVGVPTVWPIRDVTNLPKYWHNSAQTMELLSEEKIKRMQSLIALWLYKTASVTKDDLKYYLHEAQKLAQQRINNEAKTDNSESRIKFFMEAEVRHIKNFANIANLPEISDAVNSLTMPEVKKDSLTSPWLEYARGIIPTRLTTGLPYDLIKARKGKRLLPTSSLYGPFSIVLSAMDGKRDLAQLITGAIWENGAEMTEKEIRNIINATLYLSDCGYISIQNKNPIGKNDIKTVLDKFGIKKGDVVLVHSSLSGCGHVTGGENTIIDAFCEAVGKEGAVLFPTFNYSFAGFDGTHNKSINFRPYSPRNIDSVWTGSVPQTALRRNGVKRSAHSTHSWCGFGDKADYCLSSQGLLDPPADENSPMAKALELGGKVVFFGCSPASNTFIHFLEDRANGKYLQNAIVQIEREDGNVYTELIHKHLPGCRDFYTPDITKVKFYNRAVARGLEIQKEPLVAGYLYHMELKPLYEIGMKLFEEDKNVTLCDKPECAFCKKYRN
ncbi:MAG: M28 family peptidase [Ruminococcaceae bacterium]|nr:M28 family peptidase [Oscillospiraceae bacterium]